MKKLNDNPIYRLFIRLVDESKPIRIDEAGRKWIPTKWIEVLEADIGSIKIPNKEIIEFRFEPIEYEKEETPKNILLQDALKYLLGNRK